MKGQHSRGSCSAAGPFSSKWRQRGEVICWMSHSLVGDGKVKASLGCSDQELVEFRGLSQYQAFCDSVRAEDTGSIYKVWCSLDNWIIICQKYLKMLKELHKNRHKKDSASIQKSEMYNSIQFTMGEINLASVFIPPFVHFSFSLWFWFQDMFQYRAYSGGTHLLKMLRYCWMFAFTA